MLDHEATTLNLPTPHQRLLVARSLDSPFRRGFTLLCTQSEPQVGTYGPLNVNLEKPQGSPA